MAARPTGAKIWRARCASADVELYAQHLGGYSRHRIWYLRVEAILSESRGAIRRAQHHLQAALSLAARIALPGDRWQIAAEMGRLYQHLGEEEEAAAMFEEVAEIGEMLATTILDETMRVEFLRAQQKAVGC